MGSDAGPEAIVAGAAEAVRSGIDATLKFFGRAEILQSLVSAQEELTDVSVIDVENVVAMTDKPMHVLRRGRDTSMWAAVTDAAEGNADAIVSGGNTGALMAVARRQFGMIDGVDRPAISAFWPTPNGRSVVLDVGANVEADEKQLVDFAIMGEAYFRAITGKSKPSVGLLNVGAEELKGHELIKRAASVLREADPEMDFRGFIEGNDISAGAVDVVVTDGFTGNIALKSAEGAARLVSGWMKDALTGSFLAKMGALLMMRELKKLKTKSDPSSVNGGVFLGLNGIVVKSHGSADAAGVASAIRLASSVAGRGFRRDVAQQIAIVTKRWRAQQAAAPLVQSTTAQDELGSSVKAVV